MLATHISVLKWVVRDSLSNLQTIPFDPFADLSALDSTPILEEMANKSKKWLEEGSTYKF